MPSGGTPTMAQIRATIGKEPAHAGRADPDEDGREHHRQLLHKRQFDAEELRQG